jgi:L-lactate dehydrogenase complex protein LldG
MTTLPPVEQFRQGWERLAGQAYVLADWEHAAAAAARLLHERQVRRVALAGLEPAVERLLPPQLWGLGIVILDWHDPSQSVAALAQADAGLTMPQWAIAETGTLIEVVRDDAARLVSTLPRIHVAFLPAQRIVADFDTALQAVRDVSHEGGPLAVTLISGPSRTGDIELRHVLGVHGPHEVHAFIVTGA